jgi:hypothetical protein
MGDSTIAIARKQLCGQVVSLAMREHAIMEEMVFCAVCGRAI